MDRGAWWATVHGVAKSWTLTEQAQSIREKNLKKKKKNYMCVCVSVCVCTTEPLFCTLEIYTILQILYFNITTNDIESPCIISQLQISGKHFCLGFTRAKVCVCMSETAREGEKGKNLNYLQQVYCMELDVETLEMKTTKSLF